MAEGVRLVAVRAVVEMVAATVAAVAAAALMMTSATAILILPIRGHPIWRRPINLLLDLFVLSV